MGFNINKWYKLNKTNCIFKIHDKYLTTEEIVERGPAATECIRKYINTPSVLSNTKPLTALQSKKMEEHLFLLQTVSNHEMFQLAKKELIYCPDMDMGILKIHDDEKEDVNNKKNYKDLFNEHNNNTNE